MVAIINGRRQSISFLLIQNRTSVKYKTDCPEFKEIIKVPFMVRVNNLIGCLQPYKLYSFVRVRSSPSVFVLYSLVYYSSLLIKISGNSLENFFYRRNLSNQSTCSHKWYYKRYYKFNVSTMINSCRLYRLKNFLSFSFHQCVREWKSNCSTGEWIS